MNFGRAAAALAWFAVSASVAQAKDFTIEDVESVSAYGIDVIKPAAIIFNDRSNSADSIGGPAPGLIYFDHWSRTRPDEKEAMSLFPGYAEPGGGKEKGRRNPERLTVYVAEARFVLDRAITLNDLSRYTTLSFVERVDPAIKHQLIKPEEVAPLTNPSAAHNRNPARSWCVGTSVVCLRSHYQLEGKLPLGIRLANKVRDAKKKIAEYLEFESELTARGAEELDQAKLVRLTGIETPIIGSLEQTTFYVNQVLQFGRSVIIFQQHPSQAGKTVVTAFVAIAMESKLLNTKKEYAKVPVLRNLVPVQVLMGKSSFNTGSSISAGLPNYARSRVRLIANILSGE